MKNSEPIPEGFVIQDDLCFGKRLSHPGLFGIKFHSPKTYNAINTNNQVKLVELLKQCENDEEVKVILLHGGRFFSSGSDISGFRQIKNMKEFHKY